MPVLDGDVLALLADEFFMTEGQVLLRGDAAGARRAEACSIPPPALERRLGPDGTRAFLDGQRAIAELFDARPGTAAGWRDRLEAAPPEALPALHGEIAADPFFRDVARHAIELFFLYYPTWESYIGTVHPGAAHHPERHAAEAAEARRHYDLMREARERLGRGGRPADGRTPEAGRGDLPRSPG